MTKQRSMIFEVLKSTKGHPTAYQIHDEVRQLLPQISLGTVYRNLDILSELGMINQFNVGGMRRFDADLNEHNHIRCVSCGKIDDFPGVEITLDRQSTETTKGYKVLGQRVDFFGICRLCHAKGAGSDKDVNDRMTTSN